MHELLTQNQTPQSISADISTHQAATSAEPVAQNEAIKELSPETPHYSGTPTPVEPTPHTAIPIEPPLQTAVIVPRETGVPAKTVAAPMPQTEASVPATKMTAAPDTTIKARAAIQSKKRQKLDLILEEVCKKGSISNNEVEKLLGVSDATASRYLATLQKDGELKRLGRTGKAVRYQLE